MPEPFTFLLLLLLAGSTSAQTTRMIWLDDLEIQTFSEGLRPVKAKHNYQDDTLRTKGVRYARGLGAQSPCVLAFALNRQAKLFSALVGPDDLGNQQLPLLFM